MKFKDFQLRERKTAQTKVELLRALLKRINSKPFSEISIKELCDEVNISEATFFNYFSRKTDLLVYYIQFWAVDSLLYARKQSEKLTGLGVIESIFLYTAEKLVQGIRIMEDIIAFMATGSQPPEIMPISPVELAYSYGDSDIVSGINPEDFRLLFIPYLKEAIQTGEISRDTDVQITSIHLWSIFFGVPLLMRLGDKKMFAVIYKSLLDTLWNGLRS